MAEQLADIGDERVEPPTPLSPRIEAAASDAERWPTAGELYFEAGLVLAGALGIALAMNLLLALFGVRDPV